MSQDAKIKVFIVDDSVVIRNFLASTLAADPRIEVVGRAANGKLALKKLETTEVDLITLDVEMPEMNGIETLKELSKISPRTRAIMFSTLTERGAQTTLEALSLGAADYATKPTGGPDQAGKEIQEVLIPKIIALGAGHSRSKVSRTSIQIPVQPSQQSAQTNFPPLNERKKLFKPQILVIGISTGGPNALAQLIPSLPENFPLPVLIVQHMPPIFTKSLAERLNKVSALTVVEAVEGDIVKPGHVYIAPGGSHMVVKGTSALPRIGLTDDPPENSCKPAADPLFRSAAAHFPRSVLCLVMTGMGYDGAKGALEILRAGGVTVAQDEASSVVWGMPGALVHSGCADYVVPLDGIKMKLQTLVSESGHGK